MKHVKFIRQLFIVVLLMCCLNIQAADDSDLITTQITITLSEAGTLSNKISDNKKYKITNLKIIGEINGTDLRLIREMVGRDAYGCETSGKLSIIDLSEAKIVTGGDYYYCNGTTRKTNNDEIGTSAFENCRGLRSLTIPSSVTSIGQFAFYDCSGLTNMTIPSNVIKIGSWAFSFCRNLTNLTISSGVTSIGDDAFFGCSSLTSLTIPSSVIEIGNGAFFQCSGLTSLTIPSSVTSISSSTFSYCSGLTSLTIPTSVTEIGGRAFSGCI